MSVGSLLFNEAVLRINVPVSNLTLTGDFTIEFFIKCDTTINSVSYPLIMCNNTDFSPTSDNYMIYISHQGARNKIGVFSSRDYYNSTTAGIVLKTTDDMNDNVWHHIAIVRNGSGTDNTTMYVDGISNGSRTDTFTWNYNVIAFGSSENYYSQTEQYYNGSLSNVRIVNGTAVYTANFTPPKTNLDPISGTVLLLNTSYNSPITDSSPNNLIFTSTSVTSPTHQTDSPVKSNICFKEGTRILTDKGYILIEQLRKNDLVKTLNHGFVPIHMIGTSIIYNSGNQKRTQERLYKYSMEHNPELIEELFLTGCHSVLTNELTDKQRIQTIEIVDRIFVTDGKYRLMSCINEKCEPYDQEGHFNIWHLSLDNSNDVMNYGIYANGLLVESTCKARMINSVMTII